MAKLAHPIQGTFLSNGHFDPENQDWLHSWPPYNPLYQVQALGFSGEIGYQSFLYPSQREVHPLKIYSALYIKSKQSMIGNQPNCTIPSLWCFFSTHLHASQIHLSFSNSWYINLWSWQVRSLLLFLTEKLPRVEEESVGGTEQPIALARRKIGQAISQKLDAKKVMIRLSKAANTTFSGIWDQGVHLWAILWLPSLLPSRAGFFSQTILINNRIISQVVGWSMGKETRNACLSSSLIETNALLRIGNQQQKFSIVLSPVQVMGKLYLLILNWFLWGCY